MFAEGVSAREVAAALEVSTKSAYTWRRLWVAGGEQTLASKGTPGPARALSQTQVQKLIAKLNEGRLIYRLMLHRGRKGEPKGFGENHFAALLDAAHQQLGGPILLVWTGCRHTNPRRYVR